MSTHEFAAYLTALGAARLPTPAQTREFAEYVSTAHSWYKHLPMTPPGAPFTFFLDPNAGRRQVRNKARQWIYEDMPEGEQFFHYNQMPTTEYRRRFGIWNYSNGSSPRFIVRDGPAVERLDDEHSDIRDDSGKSIDIPPRLIELGTVRVTAFLSKATTYFTAFLLWPPKVSPGEPDGPDSWQTRCQNLIAAIRAREQQLEETDAALPEENQRQSYQIDEIVTEEFKSELVQIHHERRQLELDLMETAMTRVLGELETTLSDGG